MVYIQTDGTCYACSDSIERGIHKIGHIDIGVQMKKIRLDRFRCVSCPYRRLCMGRCGRMHIEFSERHIAEYCSLNQFMFDLFLTHKAELNLALKQNPAFKTELESSILEYTEFTP